MYNEQLSATFIAKILQKNSTEHFICMSLWQSDAICLQILDCNKSNEWEGKISLNELKQSAEELEIPYEKFYNECKEALTQNAAADHFQYVIEEKKFILTKNDQFQIQYLEVDLRPCNNLHHTLMFSAVDLIASLRSKLSEKEEGSKVLGNKYESLVKALEKCMSEKEVIETRLLQKFTVLLNAKKDKIAELQDLLLVKNTNREAATGTNKRKSTEMLRNSIDNEDDDDFMRSTQVMTQPVVTLPKRKKFNAANDLLATEVEPVRVGPSVSSKTHENDDANVTIGDSPDIFDQL